MEKRLLILCFALLFIFTGCLNNSDGKNDSVETQDKALSVNKTTTAAVSKYNINGTFISNEIISTTPATIKGSVFLEANKLIREATIKNNGFTFRGIPNGSYKLIIIARDYATTDSTITVKDGDLTIAPITLSKILKYTVYGTVLSSNTTTDASIKGNVVIENDKFSKHCDIKNNSYEFKNIPAGDYSLYVIVRNCVVSPIAIAIKANTTLPAITVKEKVRVNVSGTVSDPTTTSSIKARVIIEGEKTFKEITTTTGAFSFKNIETGKYKVYFVAKDYITTSVSITVDSSDVTLTPVILQKELKYNVKGSFVVTTSGVTVNNASLTVNGVAFLTCADKQKYYHAEIKDNNYDFGKVLPGKYKLYFTSRKYQIASKDIEVKNSDLVIDPITVTAKK